MVIKNRLHGKGREMSRARLVCILIEDHSLSDDSNPRLFLYIYAFSLYLPIFFVISSIDKICKEKREWIRTTTLLDYSERSIWFKQSGGDLLYFPPSTIIIFVHFFQLDLNLLCFGYIMDRLLVSKRGRLFAPLYIISITRQYITV